MFKTTPLREEVKTFILFLFSYVRKKTLLYAHTFEYGKSLIVALLIAKRGKYQSSFLNASFLLFVVTIWVAGPIIAENNPLLGSNLNSASQKTSPVVSIYSLGGTSDFITTRISRKPRDRIEYYTIKEGDTLLAIAKKFDVTVNTLKWANELKNDTLGVGKQLKIPPVSGIVHKVESGDNVYTIAKKYGTDAQKIVNFPFNDFV
ncbi:MAG: LysM peptidoglycan-binding domain-containing protein, partial [Patescibacteria group bacterium]